MSEQDDHGAASHEAVAQQAHGEVASPTGLLITFFALTFGTVFVVLVLAVYHNTYKTNLIATSQEGWTAEAESTFATRRGQEDHLSSYGTVNADRGQFHIPIDAAAALVVEEYAGLQVMGTDGAPDGDALADALANDRSASDDGALEGGENGS